MANPTPASIQGPPITATGERLGNSQTFSNAGGSALNFPGDLGRANLPYWMSFSFYEYQRPTFADNPILGDKGTIRLPLPNRMNDQQGISYEIEKMGLAMGAAINKAQSDGGAGAGVAAAVAGKALGKITGAVDAFASSPAISAAAQIGGYAANPFLTVMFKNPEFKTHSLSWKLAPTNEAESQILNNIINTFRFNALPDAVVAGLLLTYPNVVQIKVSNASAKNFTYLFKPAVVKSFTVNWAPQGQPSFFGSSQAPTVVEISLEIMEIEFWLQRDIGTPQNAGATNLSNFGSLIKGWTAGLG